MTTPGIDSCMTCGSKNNLKPLPGADKDSDLYCEKHREEVSEAASKEFLKNKLTHLPEVTDKNITTIVLTHLVVKQRPKATEIIVQDILKKHHIYTTRDDEKPEMWIYEKGIYRPNGRTHITERVREILGEAFTNSLCADVLRKIEADTYVEQEEFFTRQDNEPHLLPVENGILNIHTQELSPFTPKKFFFNKLPVQYDPQKDCPAIKKFLKDILKPQDIPPIQEYVGFCLLREYKYEKSLLATGTGRNGKGKLLDLIRRLMGADNCSAISLQDIEKDQYAVGELHTKLVNVAGDISKEAIRNSGMYKALTGRDLVHAARKYKTRVSFVNYAKFIFSANEVPRTSDLTPAFFLRWIIIDFPYQFLPRKELETLSVEEKKYSKLQDPAIIEKIATPQELSGFLNWSLTGLKRLAENREFSYGATSSQVKELWIRKSDSFQAFCMDYLEEDYDSEITKPELRQRYIAYCREHKVKSVSDRVIKAVLAEQYGVSEAQPRTGGDSRARIWLGVKFRVNVEQVEQVEQGISNSPRKKSSKAAQNMVFQPFRLFQKDNSDHFLRLIEAYGQPVPIEVLEQQAKQFPDLDFDNWLNIMKRDGKLYEPKRGYVTLI